MMMSLIKQESALITLENALWDELISWFVRGADLIYSTIGKWPAGWQPLQIWY